MTRQSTLYSPQSSITRYLLPPELVRRVLKLDNEILALARDLYEEKSLLLMGRGYNYATCLEGALKVKEVGNPSS